MVVDIVVAIIIAIVAILIVIAVSAETTVVLLFIFETQSCDSILNVIGGYRDQVHPGGGAMRFPEK